MLHKDLKMWAGSSDTALPRAISKELAAYLKWRKALRFDAVSAWARMNSLSDLYRMWREQYLTAKVKWLATDLVRTRRMLTIAKRRIAYLESIVGAQSCALQGVSDQLRAAQDSIGKSF